MKRGFGRSRAGSFLWRLRGAESSDGDSNSADDAPSQPHSARAAVWQSQPEFRTSNLPRPREKPELKRRGSLGAWLLRLRVSRDKSDEEERKYTGTTSDEDDHSYAEDDNHDSGRVNSRTYRKRKRTGRRRAKRVSADDYESADEMAHSTSRARGPRGGRGEDKEDEEETTSLSSEEDSTEECVAVDSDEDSDESSGSSETDSTEDEEAVDNLRRQERVQERRQREKRKAEEKKRLRRVEKRKLQKLANQRKREGLGELQRQLQKRREEKEIRRQEEKHWKELRRIEKFLDKARQKEEKKARKTQLQEQRQREARARQEQLRYILLARLGRPSSDEAAARGADAGAATVHQEQLRAVGHEAAAPSGTEQTADEAAGQPVGHERAIEATAERKTQVEAGPSIIGLPSAVKGSRPAKEVVTIAVTEPCRPPSRGDETEEAEDEESEDTSVKRATTNRGRVTDIPALRLGACPPKRSPKTQASSAQLIRGLIGFDQLADALFELNREVEELRNLTS